MKWILVLSAIGYSGDGNARMQTWHDTLDDCHSHMVRAVESFGEKYPFVNAACSQEQEATDD